MIFGLQLLPSLGKTEELQSNSDTKTPVESGAPSDAPSTPQTSTSSSDPSTPSTPSAPSAPLSGSNETPDEDTGPSIDEIFEKTFKKKRSNQSREVLLSVFDGSNNIGIIKSWFDSNQKDIKIEFDRLFKILSKLIDESHLAKETLEEKAVSADNTGGLKTIELSNFQNTPYSIQFNASTLELQLKIPPEIRLTQSKSLYESIRSDSSTALPPNRFSAYTNVFLDQEVLSGTDVNNENSRQPLRARFESTLNLDSWVIESNNTYIENQSDLPQKTFTRGDLRLVKDYPKWMLRQSLGDLRYLTKGYQTQVPLAGISLVSNYLLRSSFLTVTSGNHHVFLKRPSKIIIYVNGHQRQILDLPAGTFDIRDISLNLDKNNVKIEIIDDLGQKEEVDLFFYFHPDLLGTGVHQASYVFGYPLINLETGERAYDTHSPTLTFFHRYGLLQGMTIGANVQKNPTSSLLGLEALFGTKIGFFRIEPALSSSPNATSGFAANISFIPSLQQNPNTGYRYLYFSLNSRTPSFTGFSNYFADTISAHDFSASYSQAFDNDLQFNLNTYYQFNRKNLPNTQDSYSVGIGLGKTISHEFSLSATLMERKLRTGASDASISFFLRWNPRKENQSVSANYNPRGDNFKATWASSTRTATLNTLNVQASLNRSSDRRGIDGSIQYSGQRGYISLFHKSTWTDLIMNGSESTNAYSVRSTSLLQSTSAQLGFSGVYAGGHFGLSRPISDSFVMFNTVKNTRGQQLEINPKKDGSYVASNDWLSPAVIPDIASYQENQFTLGTGKFDPGILVDQDHFKLLPTYKSGYSIEIGTDATIRISAKLLNEDNSPISREPGAIHSLTDPTSEPIVFFTGTKGKITVDRLKPGKYELRLFKESWEAYPFEVLPDSEMLVNLGDVIIKKR